MATWCELRHRLQQSETIDKVAQEQFKKEKEYWKNVIVRIIAVVKYLATYNLAFRGKKKKVDDITGQGLFEELENVINYHDLDIDNVSGQGCDNGSTMKALLQLADVDNDSKIQSEAKSLATNEILSKDMLIDIAMSEIKGLISFFKNYRDVGFSNAMDIAKTIAIEIGIDQVFPHRRMIRRKRQFDELNGEETSLSPEESFRIQYFICIVDQVIPSLENRFEQYELYESDFGFLFNSNKLQSMDDIKLQSCCINFENALRKEMSFSKLKLIKSYLRTTMSQERLNGLALMAIESNILEEVDTESVIDDFVSKNVIRASRFK
ncbi:uncharacterized protein LOC120145913 [Hibiscus syriacus]|uniref:uncharacterized protein LOC120145913 n=1 Tax=Hibiscus syriacus TaxID=106335 RepID=UPI001924921E|nr:uncharacterized protein LOC120145913 [Hibiscus syriacus]